MKPTNPEYYDPQQKTPASVARKEAMLTVEEYWTIKRLQKEGKHNGVVTQLLRLPYMQVNFAYLTDTYEAYERAYLRP